jgi:hypothetical protein
MTAHIHFVETQILMIYKESVTLSVREAHIFVIAIQILLAKIALLYQMTFKRFKIMLTTL